MTADRVTIVITIFDPSTKTLSLNDFRAAELSYFNIPVTVLAFNQLAFSLAENCSQIQPLGVRTDDGIILTGSGSISFVYSLS